MTKISSNTSCENSLKMVFLKEYESAFATGNVEFLIEKVIDEIVWNIIGKRKIEGKANFTAALNKMKKEKTVELVLNQILSHGKEGATNGTLKMQNGKNYAYSDLYTFKSTKGEKIKAISSYLIKI